jgi:hypothetical protein
MTEKLTKKRSGGLTFWLAVILFGNAIFVIAQIWPDAGMLFFPIGPIFFFLFNGFSMGSPVWSMPLFVVYAIVSLCAIGALFMWRKIGFYAVCLASVAAFLTGVSGGTLTMAILADCVSTIVLAILLRSEWKLFR